MALRSLIRSPAFQTALLALLAIALYLPTLRDEFVYDSRGEILSGDYVHEPRHIADVLTLRIMRQDVLDNDRPFVVLTYLVDSLFWGRKPFGYHLTNILLHAAAVAAFFSFCRALLPSAAAFLSALVFAVHPLACEAVAEVSNRKDVLAALMLFLGLRLAVRFRPGDILAGWACGLCFFLAVAAKETGAAGPVVLLVYWWLYRRHEPRRGWAVLIAGVGIAVGLFVTAVFVVWPAVTHQQSVIFHTKPGPLTPTLGGTLLVQVRIWAFELRQIFWPFHLAADYTPYSVRHFMLGWSGAALGLFLALQVGAAAWGRAAILGAVLFWAALLPASNIIPIYCPIADRFLYLPLAGLALSLGVGAARFGRRSAALGLAVGLALAALLATLTWRRERVWRDAYSLWSDTLAQNPWSIHALTGLGCAELDRGEPQPAIRLFSQAEIATNGESAGAFSGQALGYEEMGKTIAADFYYAKAVAKDRLLGDPEIVPRSLVFDPDQLPVWLRILRRNQGGRR